jgi:hypothetical protein
MCRELLRSTIPDDLIGGERRASARVQYLPIVADHPPRKYYEAF